MNVSRQKIRRAILRVLKEAQPFALPQVQLLEEVNRLVRPAISESDLQADLSWLKDREAVGFMTDPFDDKARKWHVREAGLAMLNS